MYRRWCTRYVWVGGRTVSVLYSVPWSDLKRRKWLRPDWEDTEMALLRRNTVNKDGTPSQTVQIARPDDFAGCDHVWDFLTMRVWPDNHKARATGSVLLFSDDTGLKVRLQDNDCDQVAFALIDAEAGVWASVEAMLTTIQTDWRPYVRPGGGRRK